MCRHEGCSLRAQAALAQAHRHKSGFDGLGHLLLAEVAFRAHQDQGILTRDDGFLQELLLAFVTMADELLSLEILGNELLEVGHFVQHGLVGLERLLDGRDEDFLDAFGLDDLAFRITSIEEGGLFEAYLGGLLGKPFGAVHVLGGSHGHVQPSGPSLLLRQGLGDFQLATLVGGGADHRLIEAPLSVGQGHFIACGEAEHTQAMSRFFFGHFAGCGYVGCIKYVHNSFILFVYLFP